VVEPSAIKITKRHTLEAVNPRINDAYRAYQRGDLGRADHLYRAVLSQEPDQRDALLGLAALALRTGRTGDAARYYRRLIEINPRDGVAQAALAALPGDQEAGASESRIKLLMDEAPEAAHLHFSLGNLYARQGRWAEAQQAYFKAYSTAPHDPDYLFNLAVSLDRLGQSEAAIRFYRLALERAARLPVNFNVALVRSRLNALARAGGTG
jgi:tetratricopeptide (TPR) repeat protein